MQKKPVMWTAEALTNIVIYKNTGVGSISKSELDALSNRTSLQKQ